MILQALAMALLGLVWHPTLVIFTLLEMPMAILLFGPVADIVADVMDIFDGRTAAKGLDKQLTEQEKQLAPSSIDPADDEPEFDDDEPVTQRPAIVANGGRVISLDKYRKSA